MKIKLFKELISVLWRHLSSYEFARLICLFGKGGWKLYSLKRKMSPFMNIIGQNTLKKSTSFPFVTIAVLIFEHFITKSKR